MSGIQIEVRNDVAYIYFTDPKITDSMRIEAIGDALREAVDNEIASRIVLNLREVSFISSPMITKLVTMERLCKKQGIALRICEVAQPVMEVLKLTKLTKYFTICDSEEQATVSFELNP